MKVNERLKNYIEHIGIKQRVISAEELEIYCNALKITPNDIYQFNGC
jgi:hypothetical protein